MNIQIKWLFNDRHTIIKNSHVLNIPMPVKVNLKWKITLSKQVEKYCRKDVNCSMSYNGMTYNNLSSRNPKLLVSNIAKIIIDNNKNLNIGNVSENYVKH